jgi:hypothetical protein
MTKAKKAEGPKVLVENAIADGNGGYLPKGSPLPAGCDIESLKAKGLAA